MVKKGVSRESSNKCSCITNAFSSKHAQGTIEYLIVIAIIIVIGLVVVGLLVNQTGSSGNISSSVSKIFSSSGMISISEAVVDGDGNGLISLSNNSGGSIVVTRLSVNGVDTNYSNVSLIFGDKKIFSLSDVGTGCSCVGLEGETRTCNVIVYANSEHGLQKTFTSTVTINCVADAIAANPSNLVQPILPPDTTPPTISLFSPVPNYILTSGDSNINFIFSANETIRDCNLYIKTGSTWYLADVNNSIIAQDLNKVIDANLAFYGTGDHYWDINCSDTTGNIGSATDRNINYTPPVAFLATGGIITYTDSNGLNPRSSPAYLGGYTIHTFDSNGTFEVTSGSEDINVLVVAGGGGGVQHGGGGGAGGLIYNVSYPVTAQPYTITVGSGGASSAGQGAIGGPGQNSSFESIVAIGGGGGSGWSGTIANRNGGSGGGAEPACWGGGPGTGVSGQGHDGGNTTSGCVTEDPAFGGGGGAGSVGGLGVLGTAGNGGAGLNYTISGSSVGYAGGGGGGGRKYYTGGTATDGGGAGGSGTYSYGTAGTNGLGGGGGGGGELGGGSTGGSGIVIIRYLTAN